MGPYCRASLGLQTCRIVGSLLRVTVGPWSHCPDLLTCYMIERTGAREAARRDCHALGPHAGLRQSLLGSPSIASGRIGVRPGVQNELIWMPT